jgi:hypothetical protein
MPMPATGIEVQVAAQAPAEGNLADRIRALQTRASRIPHPDEPTRN